MGRTYGLFAVPGTEVLRRSLRQILALWDGLRIWIALDDDDPNSALSKVNGQPHSDRPATTDYHVEFEVLPHAQFLPDSVKARKTLPQPVDATGQFPDTIGQPFPCRSHPDAQRLTRS